MALKTAMQGTVYIKKRDPMFDVAKAFAMLMVVFSHVAVAANVFQGWAFNACIGFTMPFFFFTSGFFQGAHIFNRDWGKLLKHLRSYFQPLAWISFLYAALSFILGTIDRSCVSALDWAFRFFSGQWFVWALAGIYVSMFCVCAMIQSFRGRILAMLVMCLVFLVIPVPYAREMAPYFVLGALVRDKSWLFWRSNWFGGLCVLVFLLGVVLQGDVRTNGLGFYWTDTSINSLLGGRGCCLWIGRHLLGFAGTIGTLFVINSVSNRFRCMSAVSVLGTTTLGVYLLHQQLLKIFQRLCPIAGSSLWTVLVTLILFVGCHCVVFATRNRIRFLGRLIWGVSADG